MHALALIDLRGFPYRTPGIEDLELVAVFVWARGTARRHDMMEYRDAIVAKTPNRRVGTAGEISALVLFPWSDLARHVRGAISTVDGGFTA